MVFTDYLWFETKQRQEFIRITDDVAAIVEQSGVKEGMALVSAMHITAGVYVNDWEDGLIGDFQTWLETLAPAGHWSLPGGALEVGETLQVGVAREILEETGLIVDVGPVVEVFDRIFLEDDGRVLHHYVLIDYLCRPIGGGLVAGSDVSEVSI